jgi:ABC-type nitrate/sulfonate/bicarbonate transport system permease component
LNATARRTGRTSARRSTHAWSGFALVAALLFAWEISVSSGAVQSDSWPAFSRVLQSLVAGFESQGWTEIFGSTLLRMSAGFLVAAALGIAVGAAMGASSRAYRTLFPTVEIFRVLPIPAVIPPLIFFLGVDDPLKVTVIAFAAFFPIALNTLAGMRAVDPVHLMVARTFRVPPLRVLLKIQLPSALPYVFAGCRISLGISLIVTIVAEMIAGSEGVGYYIVSMQYAMRADDMYAAIILLSVLGYGLNALFLAAESRALHWARQAEARRGDE